MSISIVRRLTATLTLVAILCLAAPAVAAPPSRSHAPVTLGLSLLDQVASWLGRLWQGEGLRGQAPVEKSGKVTTGTNPQQPEAYRTSSIDPNG